MQRDMCAFCGAAIRFDYSWWHLGTGSTDCADRTPEHAPGVKVALPSPWRAE